MTAITKPRGLTGAHVLAIVVLFFGVVIAINAYFITEALKTFPGEDEAKSYAQGLQYNATLADRAQQAALGWRAKVQLTQDGAQGARVVVRVVDRAGAPLNGLSVTGALRRPVDAKEDHALTFTASGDGVYAATLPELATGQWALRADARRSDAHFDFGKTLQWPTQQP